MPCLLGFPTRKPCNSGERDGVAARRSSPWPKAGKPNGMPREKNNSSSSKAVVEA